MEDKKYVVPDGMRLAVADSWTETTESPKFALAYKSEIEKSIEAALGWLRENLPIGSRSKTRKLYMAFMDGDGEDASVSALLDAWFAQTFSPEPDMPRVIADLVWNPSGADFDLPTSKDEANDRIIEAYNRGKESK